jgi:hypothetical protein
MDQCTSSLCVCTADGFACEQGEGKKWMSARHARKTEPPALTGRDTGKLITYYADVIDIFDIVKES